jgi:hypothetical protein
MHSGCLSGREIAEVTREIVVTLEERLVSRAVDSLHSCTLMKKTRSSCEMFYHGDGGSRSFKMSPLIIHLAELHVTLPIAI